MSSSSANALYDEFAAYENVGKNFCTFCHTEEEIDEVTSTPLRELDPTMARSLMWESADHWENADIYRHYLPRILEILGSPWNEEPMYPLHVSETLLGLGFREWPPKERATVIDYLENGLAARTATFHVRDRDEWVSGIAALRGGSETTIARDATRRPG